MTVEIPQERIPGERALAGPVGAVIALIAAICAGLWWVLRPDMIASPVLQGIAVATALGAVAFCLLMPWERLAQRWIPVVTLGGPALIAAACANTGGSRSPLAIFFVYSAVTAAYFGTPRQSRVMLGTIVLLIGLPVAYDAGVPVGERLLSWLLVSSLATALAVYVARQREHVRRAAMDARSQALRDPLTGVANRRAFDERASSEVARARRREEIFTVLYLDLDGFKAVNEAAGHAAGDDVLRRVALAAAAALRGEDFVARYGGDEFAVLLPEASPADGRRVAARLVAAIERVGADEHVPAELGASVGMATYPIDGQTLDDLLEAADRELRRVKHQRRVDRERSLTDFPVPSHEPLADDARPLAAVEPHDGEEAVPHRWRLATAGLLAGGLGAAVAALWFAGPLLVPGRPLRAAVEVVAVLAAVALLTLASRHATGGERTGWTLAAAGALLALVPVVGIAGGLAFGAGVLLAGGLPSLRDRKTIVDWADIVVLLVAFSAAFVVPSLLDDPDLQGAGLGYALGAVGVTVAGLSCALMVTYRTAVSDRPDLWLLAFAFAGLGAVSVPFQTASTGGTPLPTEPSGLVVVPLAAVLCVAGAWLRLDNPARRLVDGPARRQRHAPWPVVGSVLFASLLVLFALADGQVPRYVIGLLVVTLALRHLRARVTDEENERLTEAARQNERELAAQYRASLVALSTALEARDGYTGEHGAETVQLARGVARRLGLSDALVAETETVALLHDVGKIGMPDDILRKPGPLTDEELAVVREHPIIGERILRSVPGLERVARAVRHEHEHWDGAGYPDALAGEAIPLPSRIALVCDAFHAMTSDRPYRSALPLDEAVDELRACAGGQFDPVVVKALVDELTGVPEDLIDPMAADMAAIEHERLERELAPEASRYQAAS